MKIFHTKMRILLNRICRDYPLYRESCRETGPNKMFRYRGRYMVRLSKLDKCYNRMNLNMPKSNWSSRITEWSWWEASYLVSIPALGVTYAIVKRAFIFNHWVLVNVVYLKADNTRVWQKCLLIYIYLTWCLINLQSICNFLFYSPFLIKIEAYLLLIYLN